jgi:hypothetical protein
MTNAHLKAPSMRGQPAACDHALSGQRFWGRGEKSEVLQGYEDI